MTEEQLVQPLTSVSRTETPQVNPEKKPKPWLIAVLATFLITSLAINGFFVYQNSFLRSQLKSQTQTPEPSNKVEQTSKKSESKKALTNSFQEILAKHCYREDEQLAGEKIDYENIPILLDESVVNVEGKISCSGDIGIENSRYLVLKTNKGSLLVYDSHSSEMGHGGPSFLHPYPKTIAQGEWGQLSLFLFGSMGCDSPEIVSLNLKINKPLELSNGSTIYVTSDVKAIEDGNPRLISILEKWVKECKLEGELYSQKVDTVNSVDEVANFFFSDVSNLSNPEKDKFNQLKEIIQATSPK